MVQSCAPERTALRLIVVLGEKLLFLRRAVHQDDKHGDVGVHPVGRLLENHEQLEEGWGKRDERKLIGSDRGGQVAGGSHRLVIAQRTGFSLSTLMSLDNCLLTSWMCS